MITNGNNFFFTSLAFLHSKVIILSNIAKIRASNFVVFDCKFEKNVMADKKITLNIIHISTLISAL